MGFFEIIERGPAVRACDLRPEDGFWWGDAPVIMTGFTQCDATGMVGIMTDLGIGGIFYAGQMFDRIVVRETGPVEYAELILDLHDQGIDF